MPSGDDLEDDFAAESLDLQAASEEEDVHGSEDEDYEEFHGIEVKSGFEDGKSVSKKRKRKEKEKEKKAKKKKLATWQEAEELPSVASQRPLDIGNYLFALQEKAFAKLSTLELEELRIPDSCIADTVSYTESRTLDHLGDFISQILPHLMTRLGQKPRANGAPTLIFIAGAALRVADITRTLRRHRADKGGEVAKLFARHFKVQEHVTYLKRTKVGVAVGTPARLGQLLEIEALALTALTHIIIDMSYRDAKKRSMMDIPETRDEVFRSVLGNEGVRTALHLGKIQLVLF